MELREYVRLALRWGWIVAILAVLAAGGAYVVSERQTPVYEASLKLSVRPARADEDLGRSVGALLRSLAGDITAYSFLQQVVERGQFEAITADALLSGKTLAVEVEPADYTIAITVRHPDASVAVSAANEIAALFVARREAWNEKQNPEVQIAVQVLDYARNAGVYSPKTKLYVAGGGFLGAAVGAFIVAVVEWLEAATVHSLQDLEHLDMPVLGAIPSRSARRR
jgi:capsular polysaccharide biosynthesis protein